MRLKKQNGVTFIEVMIAVVLIGILAGLALASFTGFSEKVKLRNQSRDIMSNLRLARSLAVAAKEQYGIFFDTGNQRFVLFKDKVNPSSYTYEAGDSAIYTQNLESVNFGACSFPNNTVCFKPSGSANAGGQVGLYSCSGASDLMSIDLLASTGRVRLQSQ